MELLNLNDIGRNIENLQEKFLESNIGKAANKALDLGLEYILPDFIEDDVIEIKDSFIQNGFNEGVNNLIENLKEKGKNIKGLFTGEFESINQVKEIIKKDGLLDGVSSITDNILEILKDKKIINNSVYKLIKSGKKEILNILSDDLDNLYEEQSLNFDKLNEYNNKWNEAYKNKDFDEMEKNYKKIKKLLDKTLPVENTLKEARKIENIHNLIKNNDKNFNISEEEKELINKIS